MTESSNEIRSRLELHVDRLAGLIGPRHLGKPKSIDATLGYLRNQWQDMGYEVQDELFDAMGFEARNLVVQVKGTSRASETVLLGAHYDTVETTPGADDNASAIAVLLEVSRLLQGQSGKRSIRFVAFACEEPPYFNLGCMGSQYHARQSKLRGDKIVGMLCLEMVGYFRDELGSQIVPPTIPKFLHRFFPRRGNFLAAIGNLRSCSLTWSFRRGFKRATRLPLFSLALPESVREIRLSDNSSFWDQGYPALMLTDTSFLRNPHYHLESDTPDKLDYARMSDVTIGVASAMRRLAKLRS
jgi:Zn-dependent M28 family amino/carboxypeptidase